MRPDSGTEKPEERAPPVSENRSPSAACLSRGLHLKHGPSHARSPPLLPALWGQIQTFFSTVNRFLECCRGTGISKRQSCGAGTHGNGTQSPKTSPIFRARFGARIWHKWLANFVANGSTRSTRLSRHWGPTGRLTYDEDTGPARRNLH